MPILTVLCIIRTDPTPSIQLLLDGIQEMLARNNSVRGHLFTALTRVHIKVEFLTGEDLGVGTARIQVLLRLEDGSEESCLLVSLLLLFLSGETFGFSLGGTTLLLTELDLILNLLDVAVKEKNEAS